jgi:hypothetical protein
VKIILEQHFCRPERMVMLVEGSADELDAVFDWVNANRPALRASPFWIRSLMGWCEINRDSVGLVREQYL